MYLNLIAIRFTKSRKRQSVFFGCCCCICLFPSFHKAMALTIPFNCETADNKHTPSFPLLNRKKSTLTNKRKLFFIIRLLLHTTIASDKRSHQKNNLKRKLANARFCELSQTKDHNSLFVKKIQH